MRGHKAATDMGGLLLAPTLHLFWLSRAGSAQTTRLLHHHYCYHLLFQPILHFVNSHRRGIKSNIFISTNALRLSKLFLDQVGATPRRAILKLHPIPNGQGE
jgi:hypothetical protein